MIAGTKPKYTRSEQEICAVFKAYPEIADTWTKTVKERDALRTTVKELLMMLDGVPEANEIGLLEALEWSLQKLHEAWGTSGWKESDRDLDAAQNILDRSKTLTKHRKLIKVKK